MKTYRYLLRGIVALIPLYFGAVLGTQFESRMNPTEPLAQIIESTPHQTELPLPDIQYPTETLPPTFSPTSASTKAPTIPYDTPTPTYLPEDRSLVSLITYQGCTGQEQGWVNMAASRFSFSLFYDRPITITCQDAERPEVISRDAIIMKHGSCINELHCVTEATHEFVHLMSIRRYYDRHPEDDSALPQFYDNMQDMGTITDLLNCSSITPEMCNEEFAMTGTFYVLCPQEITMLPNGDQLIAEFQTTWFKGVTYSDDYCAWHGVP